MEKSLSWGNYAASEVVTKACLLPVENYFQTPLGPGFNLVL